MAGSDAVADAALLDALPGEGGRYAGSGADEAATALAWTRENLARRFSIAELASAVGLSERTLARRMIAAFGLPPRPLVQRIRVERAALLLETTDMRVDEIAARVGHREPSQLRRSFHRVIGRSPAQFRRWVKNKG